MVRSLGWSELRRQDVSSTLDERDHHHSQGTSTRSTLRPQPSTTSKQHGSQSGKQKRDTSQGKTTRHRFNVTPQYWASMESVVNPVVGLRGRQGNHPKRRSHSGYRKEWMIQRATALRQSMKEFRPADTRTRTHVPLLPCTSTSVPVRRLRLLWKEAIR